MIVLLSIAFKSLLIAGATLALLALMKNRSASERSWVAHVGLVALVLLACAPLVLPSWSVETPSIFSQAPAANPVVQAPPPASTGIKTAGTSLGNAPAAVQATPAVAAPVPRPLSAVAATIVIYAIPAAILLLLTLLALGRLVTLRARADVLVDGHWLSALARAQRRMGFKHGTALLTTTELASPISWGLMRPVILLNTKAVEASGEAEAIIAHELAHVARMDWIKLLLARVATALFWFNPFVWLLAREAHQLREETADDAVLAADIPDTDYAQLLVGVARHDCPSMLLGAHGVAPSRSSLSRRVTRVLDAASARAPAAKSFALGVFVGAVAIAAPLAALTLTPKGSAPASAAAQKAAAVPGSAYYPGQPVPADLPSIIGQGVATSVQSAVSAINPNVSVDLGGGDFETVAPSGASVKSINGTIVARNPAGGTVTVYPPDANGRRKIVAVAPSGATAISYAAAGQPLPGFMGRDGSRSRNRDDPLDTAIAMKAVGATPEYVAAIRSAAPQLRDADLDDIMGMKAVGVTPQYVRDMLAAGFRDFDADDLAGARAVGVDPNYVRSMASVGIRGDLDDYVSMRAVGVTSDLVARLRQAGYRNIDIDKLVNLKALQVDLEGLHAAPPQPPRPPRPPRPLPNDDDDDGN
jgi:beta-lactamase regulating signal transducer with metallopeptidase domain